MRLLEEGPLLEAVAPRHAPHARPCHLVRRVAELAQDTVLAAPLRNGEFARGALPDGVIGRAKAQEVAFVVARALDDSGEAYALWHIRSPYERPRRFTGNLLAQGGGGVMQAGKDGRPRASCPVAASVGAVAFAAKWVAQVARLWRQRRRRRRRA